MFHFDIKSLNDFLLPYTGIYGREPLFAFHEDANFTAAYPPEWMDYILNLDLKEQYQYVCRNQLPGNAPRSLIDLEILRSKLITTPKEKAHFKINPINLKVKKAHELSKLLAFISNKKISAKTIFDFAGGAGHLSRLLAPMVSANITTLDNDEALLTKGEKLNTQKNLSFKKIDLFELQDLRPIGADSTFTIGLHTCGELSRAQMDFNINEKIPQLLNIGCCYLRLDSKNWPWSIAGKKENLHFNIFSLTLATNGNTALSEQNFIHSKKIKSYRYTLACYLKWIEGQNAFKEVGESAKTLYQKDFAYYFSQKNKASIDANEFYHQENVQKTVDTIWAMDCLRWRFGRVLEFLIIKDRQQYLFENGLKSELKEIFEEHLSPRNLMIIT